MKLKEEMQAGKKFTQYANAKGAKIIIPELDESAELDDYIDDQV
jgi:ferritin